MKNLNFNKDIILPEGKIPSGLLKKLLLIVENTNKDKNILIGPSIGEDGAVVAEQSTTVLVFVHVRVGQSAKRIDVVYVVLQRFDVGYGIALWRDLHRHAHHFHVRQ